MSEDQPRIELKENGQLFELLCDSGAWKTVLTEIIVRVAHGELDVDHLTQPVVVYNPVTKPRARVVAPHGPVNLLGRGLMTALRTAGEPHGDGMNAERLSETGDIS